MLIIGTGGLARDLITFWEIMPENADKTLYFFNNIDLTKSTLQDKYKIFHTEEEVINHFNTVSKKFIVCVGNPLKRLRLTNNFEKLGGELTTFICGMGQSVNPDMHIEGGVIVQPACVIVKDSVLRKGVFVNAGTIIGHDAIINQYVSLGPGVRVLGGAEIGEFSYIGTNSIIMPGVKIGKKVRIGVAKIIEQDVPDNVKLM